MQWDGFNSWLECLPLMWQVMVSRPSQVIPKTIIRMEQTALAWHASVRVGVWECNPTV